MLRHHLGNWTSPRRSGTIVAPLQQRDMGNVTGL